MAYKPEESTKILEFLDYQEKWVQENMPPLAFLTQGTEFFDLFLNQGGGNHAHNYPFYELDRHLCGNFAVYKNVDDECDWAVVRLSFAEFKSARVMFRVWYDDTCVDDKTRVFYNTFALGMWSDVVKRLANKRHKRFVKWMRHLESKEVGDE